MSKSTALLQVEDLLPKAGEPGKGMSDLASLNLQIGKDDFEDISLAVFDRAFGEAVRKLREEQEALNTENTELKEQISNGLQAHAEKKLQTRANNLQKAVAPFGYNDFTIRYSPTYSLQKLKEEFSVAVDVSFRVEKTGIGDSLGLATTLKIPAPIYRKIERVIANAERSSKIDSILGKMKKEEAKERNRLKRDARFVLTTARLKAADGGGDLLEQLLSGLGSDTYLNELVELAQ